jgi:hypothetical protein
MGEVLVARGCPTDTDLGGDHQCFYCGGDYLKLERGRAFRTEMLNHEPDCPWPPFEEAHS